MAIFSQSDELKKKKQIYDDNLNKYYNNPGFTPSEEWNQANALSQSLLEQQRNYGPYQMSQRVADLQKGADASRTALDNVGDFRFSQDELYKQLQDSYLNRGKFQWDADSDALYQMYKDKYIQGGKLAMQDTMGQAAALTGGYGNSYAATAGNQAYQSYLSKLNDVMPELYQLALDRYNAEGTELRNKIGLLGDEYSREYGEYGDRYNRLADAYNRNYNLYNTEYNREYGEHSDAYNRLADSLNYAIKNADSIYGRETDAYDRTLSQLKDAVSMAGSDYDSDYSREYADFRNNIADQQAAASLAASRAAAAAKAASNASKSAKEDGSDADLYTYSYKDENGLTHFTYNGKDVKKETGVNPYTGTKHKDAKYGTFNNGYQPDNIDNVKLSRSNKTMELNGRTIQIWKLPDGTLWYWDGLNNTYQYYGQEEDQEKRKNNTFFKDGTTRSYQ